MQLYITWDMLKTWTSIDIQQWVGQNFDNPGNTMSLIVQIRGLFDSFYNWFEKVNLTIYCYLKDTAENTYRPQLEVDTVGTPLFAHIQISLSPS